MDFCVRGKEKGSGYCYQRPLDIRISLYIKVCSIPPYVGVLRVLLYIRVNSVPFYIWVHNFPSCTVKGNPVLGYFNLTLM